MTTLRLDDAGRCIVVHQPERGLARIVYFGASLPEGEDLDALADGVRMDVTGGMMDDTAPVSVCPEAGLMWPGQSGMMLRGDDGSVLQPVFQGALSGAEGALTITGQDAGVHYEATLRFDRGMLCASATLELARDGYVDWLAAPVVPMPAGADHVLDFSGRWIGEFQLQSTPWRPGIHMREARLGRSGHEHPPFAIVTGGGDTLAFAYGSNCGHRMVAEELPDGRRVLMFGHPMGATPKPTRRIDTGPLYIAYSADGTNGAARQFQRFVRALPGPAKARHARPVHYNCWEAIYFDHTEATLRDIAARAADLGAERFVLDDGWFGRRDDDTTSLGDWQIDPRKWPDGLKPFADHVNSLGMGFGLWFEPEMVSKNSDLYRAHPDWLLGPADQTPGRQQYVLDLSRTDVQDHLFDALSAVLASAPIEYVKWDHNRLLPVCDRAQGDGAFDLMRRLRNAFAHIEFESCASGGGRIDLKTLEVAGRVWLSDSNDALERLRIQHDAALFLPASVTGSHVGPRTCHTSGRTLSMAFRAWVAAQRHMGFEMDPRELTQAEAATLKEVTAWWKANRDWRMEADILRLDHPDPAVIAEQQMAQDGAGFVVFAGQARASDQILPRPLRLVDLDRDAFYTIRLANPDAITHLSRGMPALKAGEVTLSGAALMAQGITLPWGFPETMWVLEGTRKGTT